MVSKVRHQNPAQRPRQITGDEDAKALQQAQPLRHVRREKQLTEGQGEKHENDEIVDFQRPAQSRQSQGSVVRTGKAHPAGLSISRHKYAQY